MDILIHAHAVGDQMPDADTDVLIWDTSSDESQLGAYTGERDGAPVWVDSQGGEVPGVTHWTDMPRLVLVREAA